MNLQTLLQADLFLQVSDVTPGRLAAIIAGLVGLLSVVIGVLARSTRRISSGQRMGIISIITGLIGIVLSLLHLARTTGGFGTGKGRAGAIVALLIGLTGIILGALARARSRRIAGLTTRDHNP